MKCPFCGERLDGETGAAPGGRIECGTCHALIDPELAGLADAEGGSGPGDADFEGKPAAPLDESTLDELVPLIAPGEPPEVSADDGGAPVLSLPDLEPDPASSPPVSATPEAASADGSGDGADAPVATEVENGTVQIDDFQVEPPPAAVDTGDYARIEPAPRRGDGGSAVGSYSFKAGQLEHGEETVFDGRRRKVDAGATASPGAPDGPAGQLDDSWLTGEGAGDPTNLDLGSAGGTRGRAPDAHTGREGRDAPFSRRDSLADDVSAAPPPVFDGKREHPVFPEVTPPPRRSGTVDLDDRVDVSFDGLGDAGSPFDDLLDASDKDGERGPDFESLLRPEGAPRSVDDVFGGFEQRPRARPARSGEGDEFDLPLPPGWDDLEGGLGALPEDEPLRSGPDAGFGETLFLGTDRLEVDVPTGAAPAPGTQPSVPATLLKAPKPRKKVHPRGTSLGVLKVGLLMVLLVALVGVILGQTRYGYFGARLLSGKGGHGSSGMGTRRAAAAAGGLLGDTREAYETEVRRLDRVLREDPGDEASEAALYGTLLRYRERFPLAVASDPTASQRLQQLRTRVRLSGRAADLANMMNLAFEGKNTEARAVLDAIGTTGSQDSEVLYFHGRLSFHDRAWADARKYFGMALAAKPERNAARHFLARSMIAEGAFKDAREVVESLLQDVPGHLGARVSLAEIELAGNKLDAAAAAAATVINSAKAGADAQEQFQAFSVLARIEEARGNLEGRMTQLRAALSAHPTDEQTAAMLGRLLLAGGKRGEAIGAMRPCRERGCKSEQFLLTYAEAAFDDEQEQVATAALAEGETLYPESPRFANLLGEQELERGRVETATQAFRKSIGIDPKFVPAYRNAAKARLRAGRMTEAAEVLSRGIEQVPGSAELLLDLAEVQGQQRDFPGAEATLRAAIKLDGRHVKAKRDLGLVLERLGRFEEVVSALGALASRAQLDRDGALCLGRAYLALDREKEARDLLADLHGESPGDAEIASEYGRALAAAGDSQKAEEILTTVIGEHPQQGVAHYQLGRLMADQDRPRSAVESLQRAVQLMPRDPAVRLALARSLLAVGTTDSVREARQHLDTVIAAYSRDETLIDQRDADAWGLRGALLFDEEKFPQALKDFETALAVAPQRTDLVLHVARTLFELARFADAKPLFEQVLRTDPANPDAHYHLGRIAVRAGENRAALKHLEAATVREPVSHPDALRVLGMIYRDERMNGPARRAFERFLKLVPDGAEAEEVRQLLARMRP